MRRLSRAATTLERVAGSGPATPDHVMRTKRLPLFGRDIAAYAGAYEAYFAEQRAGGDLRMLDPAPRSCSTATRPAHRRHQRDGDARIVEDVYLHTIEIVSRADALDGMAALSAGRPVRRRVLGARAGQAQARRRRAAVPRRSGRDHGRGVGDRPSDRRRVPRGRRSGRRARPSTRRSRRCTTAPTSSASSATSRSRRRSRQRSRRPSAASAGSTCSCSTPAVFPPGGPIADACRRRLAPAR